MYPTKIFISHVLEDKEYASKLRDILDSLGIASKSCVDWKQADDVIAMLKTDLQECDLICVLVGPKTRASKFVDSEIDAFLKKQSDLPCGLLGIILPEHVDFKRPYYDPIEVPPRLHDRVEWEFGTIKHWTLDEASWKSWFDEVDRRRRTGSPSTSLSLLMSNRKFPWNASESVGKVTNDFISRLELSDAPSD
ncbi:MAG: TIR domain-containing protein [Planctomycetota bacterium]|nr:TIR domain-containing protein [Planctomycetota bacterium]